MKNWSQGMLAIIRRWIFVFHFAIQKYKDQGAHNYNFACCFVWVWNWVEHTEGVPTTKGVWEQAAEKDIWA